MIKIIKNIFDKLGFILIVVKKSKRYSYDSITPRNEYCKWLDNLDFMTSYEHIKYKTLLDIYRLYSLWELVEQVKDLKGCIIEVGSWKGGSGYIIETSSRLNDDNSNIYLCDTFKGIVKSGKEDIYKDGDVSVKSDDVELLFYHSDNVFILKGIFPDDTAKHIKDKDVKLCHIDVDVYQSAKDIFNWIWPKLVKGGIIVFDDYGFYSTRGITTLVNELYGQDKIIIYNLNGQAIIIKK